MSMLYLHMVLMTRHVCKCVHVHSCTDMHKHTNIHVHSRWERCLRMCANVCVCVRNLWEGIVRHIGQTAEQQWESNLKRRVVKRKSTCSVTVPWTMDQAMFGTWHASEVRIHFEMTRTRNVALCARAVSHARETLRVKACEVSVLFTHTVAYKGIATSCKRNDWRNWKTLMVLELLRSTACATLSNLSKTKPAKTRKVNLSKLFISVASILFFVVPQMVFVESDDLGELGDCLAVLLVVEISQYSSRLVGSLLSCSSATRVPGRWQTTSSYSRIWNVLFSQPVEVCVPIRVDPNTCTFLPSTQLSSVNICLEMITWFLGLSMFRTARYFHLHDVIMYWQYKLFFRRSFLLFWRQWALSANATQDSLWRIFSTWWALRLRRDFT